MRKEERSATARTARTACARASTACTLSSPREAASAAGVAVVLTHHSNCERGFLPVVAQRLAALLGERAGEFRFLVSAVDADPLTTL